MIVKRTPLYSVKRVRLKSFQVHYGGENESSPDEEYEERLDNNEFKDVPLPLFSKIRNVDILDDTTMTCSCCHFESC